MNTQYIKGTIKAPEFPDHLDWINTNRPLKFKDLKGKIVLLDFWTYCCINCMHVIPDLHRLEKKYPELLVIGVHSAKFEGEKSTHNIKEAVLRYQIEHPIVNDYNSQIWQEYSVKAWPTFFLIDPEGKIAAYASGEGIFELFDPLIAEMLDYWDKLGMLSKDKSDFLLETNIENHTSLLRFPGKIIANTLNNQLFISDSNNDRILIVNETGKIIDVIGSGSVGLKDGDFETACFYRPMGLAFDSDNQRLYICDLENHAIRMANLKERTITTIAGNGQQAFISTNEVKLPGSLNSPWDLCLNDQKLYIAMAGQHQLYILDLTSLQLTLLAGSGRENNIDDLALKAALAQPSAITMKDKTLYFIDSETSALRQLKEGVVETLIGKGLFDFGNIDGNKTNALMQHPLGICAKGDSIYIADTYNNIIRVFNIKDQYLYTIAGNQTEGETDDYSDKTSFNEPNGLCYMNGKLFICDTNNHRIRILDLSTKKVNTLDIRL